MSGRGSRALALAAGALVVGLAVSGLAGSGLPDGHDLWPHAVNTVEYARCFADGIVWPRWLPDLSGGYGGPNPMYYNPLPHHVSGRLMQAGLTLPVSLKVAAALSMALSFAGMYRWAAGVWGRAGGLLSATLYTLAPYHLLDLYVRFAYAELFGLAVAPWLFDAARRVAVTGAGVRRLAGGIALLVLAHNLSAVLMGGLLACYVLALVLGGAPTARGLRAAAAVPLAMALTAFFWVPVVFEADRTRLPVDRSVKDLWQGHLLPPSRLFDAHWPGSRDDMPLYPGRVPLVLGAASLVTAGWLVRAREPGARGWLAFAGFVALHLGLMLEPSRPLWQATPLPFLQFPWRFLAPVSLGLAFLAPLALWPARRDPIAHAAACGGLAAFAALLAVSTASPVRRVELDVSATALRNRVETADLDSHFVPAGAQATAEPGLPTLDVARGAARIVMRSSSAESHVASVSCTAPVLLDVRIYAFEGWHAEVDGTPAPLEREDGIGGMRLAVPAGEHEVRVAFGWTPLRSAALALSGGALVLAVGARYRAVAFSGAALALLGAAGLGWYRAGGSDPHARRARVAMRFRDHAAAIEALGRVPPGSAERDWARAMQERYQRCGLRTRYFIDPDWRVTRAERREYDLALDAASQPFRFPPEGWRSLSLTAYLDVPVDGRYDLAIDVDGEATLAVDGQVVAAARGDRLVRSIGAARLGPGRRELALFLRRAERPLIARVWWRPPGEAWALVPLERLAPGVPAWVDAVARRIASGPARGLSN